MMYPASFVFNEPSTAYICLIVINLFIGITCIITSFMLQMFAMNNNDAVGGATVLVLVVSNTHQGTGN